MQTLRGNPPAGALLFRDATKSSLRHALSATRAGRAIRAHHLDYAALRSTIGAVGHRILATLKPWYNWGEVHVERMDAIDVVDGEPRCGGEGPVRFFDLQWFGVHVGVQFGRTPRRGVRS